MGTTFFWIGNHPGVDFLNTQAVDNRGERLELLSDFNDLLTWVEIAGLVGDDVIEACRSVTDQRARHLLAWARNLRDNARRVLDPDRDHLERDAHDLAETLAAVPVRLTYQPDAPPEDLPLDTTNPVDRLRLALATAVLDATGLDVSRIRCCESESCVLIYYDSSKNRSRRWCDMAICGNRAKAAAHYQRTKQLQTRRHSNTQ